jgi:1-acyl-sn-glycerol-3-phosphate acyltransferase
MGQKIFRQIARFLLPILFRLLTRWKVSGRENLPAGGPLLVVFNHLAHLDAPLLLASLPWLMEGIALSDLGRVPVTGQLLRLYGVIWVHRDEYDRELLHRTLAVLADGGVLALAPESRMSVTGALERGRTGAAYLALKSGAPVLPIAITGTEKMYSEWRRLHRPRINVTIGQPFHLPPVELKGAGRHEALRQAADEIMVHIARLLPPEYRGVYAAMV